MEQEQGIVSADNGNQRASVVLRNEMALLMQQEQDDVEYQRTMDERKKKREQMFAQVMQNDQQSQESTVGQDSLTNNDAIPHPPPPPPPPPIVNNATPKTKLVRSAQSDVTAAGKSSISPSQNLSSATSSPNLNAGVITLDVVNETRKALRPSKKDSEEDVWKNVFK